MVTYPSADSPTKGPASLSLESIYISLITIIAQVKYHIIKSITTYVDMNEARVEDERTEDAPIKLLHFYLMIRINNAIL